MRQVGENLEMQNWCAEIKIRAERRAGELLQELDKHKGGRPPENPSHDQRGFPSTLDDLGISYDQSSRYQTIASLPVVEFETHVAPATLAKISVTSMAS
jgi:hypothetical protein